MKTTTGGEEIVSSSTSTSLSTSQSPNLTLSKMIKSSSTPISSSPTSCTTSSYSVQCTSCPFLSDYDSVFRHGVESHSIYICVCCSTHYTLAKELMVHLYREHRVPPQRFSTGQDFLKAGGSETLLCCVQCSAIFEFGQEQDDQEEGGRVSLLLDGHECPRGRGVGLSNHHAQIAKPCDCCGEAVLPGFVDIHAQTCEGVKDNTTDVSLLNRGKSNKAGGASKFNSSTSSMFKDNAQVSVTLVPVGANNGEGDEEQEQFSPSDSKVGQEVEGHQVNGEGQGQEYLVNGMVNGGHEEQEMEEEEEGEEDGLIIAEQEHHSNETSKKGQASFGPIRSQIQGQGHSSARGRGRPPLQQQTPKVPVRRTVSLMADSPSSVQSSTPATSTTPGGLDRPRRTLRKVTNDDFVFESVAKRRSYQRQGSGLGVAQVEVTPLNKSSGGGARKLNRAQSVGFNSSSLINVEHGQNASLTQSPKLPHLRIKFEDGYKTYTPNNNNSYDLDDEPEEEEIEVKLDPLLLETDPSKRLLMLIQELSDKLSTEWPGPDCFGYTNPEIDDSQYELLVSYPLEDKMDEDILTQMLRKTSINCTYCRQVKLIRIDKRQLAIHLFSKHCWTIKFLVSNETKGDTKLVVKNELSEEDGESEMERKPSVPVPPCDNSDNSIANFNEAVDEIDSSLHPGSSTSLEKEALTKTDATSESCNESDSVKIVIKCLDPEQNTDRVQEPLIPMEVDDDSTNSLPPQQPSTSPQPVQSSTSTLEENKSNHIPSPSSGALALLPSPKCDSPEPMDTTDSFKPPSFTFTENPDIKVKLSTTDISTIKLDWAEFKHTVLKKVFLSSSVLFSYTESDMPPFGHAPCECLLCGYFVDSQQNLFPHWRKIHRGVAMKCAMCQGKFLFAGALYSHLCFGTPNPIIKNDLEPQPTGFMGGKYPSYNTLPDAATHGLSGEVTVVDVKDDDAANTIVLRYQCSICEDVQLPSFFNYVVHLRKIHNWCELCLESVKSQKELEHHMKKHKLNHFCWKCGVTYCAKPNFMTHLFWKHGSESKECSVCLKKKWPHIYHFCFPPQVHVCDTCGFYFTKPKHLIVHRRLHTGEKLRKCSFSSCSEKFISKKLFDKHILAMHSGESIEDEPQQRELKDVKPKQELMQGMDTMDSKGSEEGDHCKMDGETDEEEEEAEQKTDSFLMNDDKKVVDTPSILDQDESSTVTKTVDEQVSLEDDAKHMNDATPKPDVREIDDDNARVTQPTPISTVENETMAEEGAQMDDNSDAGLGTEKLPNSQQLTQPCSSVAQLPHNPEEQKKEESSSAMEESGDPDKPFNIEEIQGPNLSEDESDPSDDDDSDVSKSKSSNSNHHSRDGSPTGKQIVDEGDQGEILNNCNANSDLPMSKQNVGLDITESEPIFAVKSKPVVDPVVVTTTSSTSSPTSYFSSAVHQPFSIPELEPSELKPVHSFSALSNGFVPQSQQLSDNPKKNSSFSPQEKQQVMKQVVHDLDLSDESSDDLSSDSDDENSDGSKSKEEKDASGSAMTNILDHCENLEKNLNQSAMDIDDSILDKSSADQFKKVTTLPLDLNVEMDLLDAVEKLKDVEDFGSMSPLLTPLDDYNFSVPDIPTFEDNSLPEHIIRENAMFSLLNEHDYCLRLTLKRGPSSPAAAPTSSCSRSVEKAQSRHKKLKGLKTKSPRKRHNSSSSSSSSSSSCGSNCSCSSSSSSSSSSGESSNEVESNENNPRRLNHTLKIPIYPHQHNNTPQTPVDPTVKRGRGRPKGSVNRNKDGVPTAKKKAPGGAGKRIGRIIVPKPPRPTNPDGSLIKRKYKKQKGKFSRKTLSANQEKENDDGSQNANFPEENFLLETDLETEDSGSEEAYDTKQLTELIGDVPNSDEIWTMSNEQYLLKFVRGVKEVEELRPPPPQPKLKIKMKKHHHHQSISSQSPSEHYTLQQFSEASAPTYSLKQVGSSESRLKVRNVPIKPLIFKRNLTSFPSLVPPPSTSNVKLEINDQIVKKNPFVRLCPIQPPGAVVRKLPPMYLDHKSTPSSSNIPVLGRNVFNTNNNNGNALHHHTILSQHSSPKPHHLLHHHSQAATGENLPEEGGVTPAPVRRAKMKFGSGLGGRRSVGGMHINILPPKPAPLLDTTSGTDEQLYCFCQCPHDNVSQMIGCDSKDCEFQWFHFECVGIVSAPRGKWYCPDCKEKRKQHKALKY